MDFGKGNSFMIFRFSLDYLDRPIDPDGKFACGDENYSIWKHAESDKTASRKGQMRGFHASSDNSFSYADRWAFMRAYSSVI